MEMSVFLQMQMSVGRWIQIFYEVGINENWNVIDSNGEYLFSETHDNHEVNEKYIAGNNEEKNMVC